MLQAPYSRRKKEPPEPGKELGREQGRDHLQSGLTPVFSLAFLLSPASFAPEDGFASVAIVSRSIRGRDG